MIINSLLKSLRNPTAQVILEYFILFGLICILTLVATSTFISQSRNSIQDKNGVVVQAAARIIDTNNASPSWCTSCIREICSNYVATGWGLGGCLCWDYGNNSWYNGTTWVYTGPQCSNGGSCCVETRENPWCDRSGEICLSYGQ